MIPSCYPGLHSNVISSKSPFLDQPGLYSTVQGDIIHIMVCAMALELSSAQAGAALYIHPESPCLKLLSTMLEHRTLSLPEIMLFIHLLYRMCSYMLPLLSQEGSVLALFFTAIFTEFKPGTWFGTSYIFV